MKRCGALKSVWQMDSEEEKYEGGTKCNPPVLVTFQMRNHLKHLPPSVGWYIGWFPMYNTLISISLLHCMAQPNWVSSCCGGVAHSHQDTTTIENYNKHA